MRRTLSHPQAEPLGWERFFALVDRAALPVYALGGMRPEHLRQAVGNRIYGCDDCQLFCPWNKFARRTTEADFAPRHELDTAEHLNDVGNNLASGA